MVIRTRSKPIVDTITIYLVHYIIDLDFYALEAWGWGWDCEYYKWAKIFSIRSPTMCFEIRKNWKHL